MAQVVEIEVKPREKTTKSVLKTNRRNGLVPSIVYGPAIEPVKIWVPVSEIKSKLKVRKGETVLIKFVSPESSDIDGRMVILKDVQIDPLSLELVHIDFYEFQRGQEMDMEISVHIKGEPVGLRKGGIVDWMKRTIWVRCLPKDLPEHLEVDISSLDIGDVIHVGDIEYPPGVRPIDDEELPVVAVVAEEKEEEVAEEIEEEEAVEPEVIARGKEEKEEEKEEEE